MGIVSSQAGTRSLSERLKCFGCPALIELDRPLSSPEQVDYLDLLPDRRNTGVIASGVAEHQGAALLYVLDVASEGQVDPARLAETQRLLANRSEPAWLGLAKPGSLEIYPIGFHEKPGKAVRTVKDQDPGAPLFFQSLVHGTLENAGNIQGADHVFKKIFELLEKTTKEFVPPDPKKQRIEPLAILSMAGRALFFRFLIDRRIVLERELGEICPKADGLKDVFASPEKAASTSAWLDETFNGDFLRLIDESIPAADRASRQAAYLSFYRRVENEAGTDFFLHLHAILNGWKPIGKMFQLQLDWNDLDFAHIPVGVLSQVYESFSQRANLESALETSVHYTPRNIARLMVDQAFAAVQNPAQAQVLDPACGAGIFLVLAFRRLVSERWKADGKRPDTRTIQRLLYEQVRGFDISESALRLAALALYITAIEINGTQRPPKALKFPRSLDGTVLHNFGKLPLGSLDPSALEGSAGRFDIVISNPPWTRLREKRHSASVAGEDPDPKTSGRTDALNRQFTAIGRRTLEQRGFSDLARDHDNPDKNPDLPFLWRATEWAKNDVGIVALAMPARLFGRTTGNGLVAWKAVLRSIEITGLVNGADLRKTAVWASMDVPFCLLFARNRVPAKGYGFVYSTPLNEPELNRQSRFRIDYEAARPVQAEMVERQPWILKTLSLGTWHDVRVVEAILGAFPSTLGQVWAAADPKGERTGQGFNLSRNLRQKHSPWLAKLKVFEASAREVSSKRWEQWLEEQPTFFTSYGLESAHMPRQPELYQPPLVIVPQAPGNGAGETRAFVSPFPVAFSQSYYGYSCAGHPFAPALAALIFLILNSTLFRYFSLMTSRRVGFDRQTFNKEELDAIPFPEVSVLPEKTRDRIEKLAKAMEQNEPKPWAALDAEILELYGLDEEAGQTMLDTLFSAVAYRRQGKNALMRAPPEQRAAFREELRQLLQPFFEVCGRSVEVAEPRGITGPEKPWIFITLASSGFSFEPNRELVELAMAEANARSSSRILVKSAEGKGLLLGLLYQARWWTTTRARLCAQHILRHHLDAFGLQPGA